MIPEEPWEPRFVVLRHTVLQEEVEVGFHDLDLDEQEEFYANEGAMPASLARHIAGQGGGTVLKSTSRRSTALDTSLAQALSQ